MATDIAESIKSPITNSSILSSSVGGKFCGEWQM